MMSMMTSSFNWLYFLQLEDVLLEGAHLLLVAQHLDDVAPRHDAQLGVQCFDKLHVGVVHAVKGDRVNIFEYNQFFYHSRLVFFYFRQR